MTELKEIKVKFLKQVDAFDTIYKKVFEVKELLNEKQNAYALMMNAQEDTPQRLVVIQAIESLHRGNNVAQFQAEAMCEYVRAFVGPFASQFAQDKFDDEQIVPEFLFMYGRMAILNDQLNFFFSNFIEKGILAAFENAETVASEMAFSGEDVENAEKTVLDFLGAIKDNTLSYVNFARLCQEWLHGIFKVIVDELATRGIENLPVPE